MNEARGAKRVDATAVVVTELVAQRGAVRQFTESMQPMMKQHMMKQMKMGLMRGMSESMSGCPRMGGEMPTEGGHEAHH